MGDTAVKTGKGGRRARLLGLTEAQLRALACQNGVKSWQIDSPGMLAHMLEGLEIVKGLETSELASVSAPVQIGSETC